MNFQSNKTPNKKLVVSTRTVRTTALLILLLSLAFSDSRAESPTIKYTGKSTVEGLGTVVFPAGEWLLEFRRVEPDSADLKPIYFVFKKLGAQLERLTFLRYSEASAPIWLLDTTGETMGDGIPFDQKQYRPPADGDTVYPMRIDPQPMKSTDTRIVYSFIHVHAAPKPSWLCHTILFSRENAVFIIAHASTSVTNPETVEDVQSNSTFSPNAMSAPKPK